MENRTLMVVFVAAFVFLLTLAIAIPYLPKGRTAVKKHLLYDLWDRTYYVYVPVGYNHSHPVPLVIMLHGAGSNGPATETQTGWSSLAESNNFIVVYPEAGAWWNAYDWEGPQTMPYFGGRPNPTPRDDAGFLLALINKMKNDYAIDGSRVYMTGWSIGGSMTITFASRFTDVLAAIAPVSSAWMTKDWVYNIDPYSVPQPKGPIPVYMWRGDQEGWPSLEEDQSQIQYWIYLDHVNETPKVVTGGGYRTEIYTGGDAEVRHTEIAGRGHESYDHNTAKKIWYDFFVRFSREAGHVKEQP